MYPVFSLVFSCRSIAFVYDDVHLQMFMKAFVTEAILVS